METAEPSGLPTASPSCGATPTTAGQSGVRGFAGDSSGALCFSSDGNTAATTGTVLLLFGDPTCNILQ